MARTLGHLLTDSSAAMQKAAFSRSTHAHVELPQHPTPVPQHCCYRPDDHVSRAYCRQAKQLGSISKVTAMECKAFS